MLQFSPDSKHVAYGALQSDRRVLVVNGVESKEYDLFLAGSKLVIDGPSSLHTLAGRGDERFRVEVEVGEP